MKQTSVEWFANQIVLQKVIKKDIYSTYHDFPTTFEIILEQAKEMHKQEIMDARDNMQKKCISIANKFNPNLFEFDENESEKYYNETYQSVDTNEMIDVPKHNDVSKNSEFNFECTDVNCPHCAEDIAQMKDDDVREDDAKNLTFEDELQLLINKYSLENDSDTPDYILSQMICEWLDSFNHAVKQRKQFYNKTKETLFTKEQVNEAMNFSFNAGRRLEINSVDDNFDFESYKHSIISSLKLFKNT